MLERVAEFCLNGITPSFSSTAVPLGEIFVGWISPQRAHQNTPLIRTGIAEVLRKNRRRGA